MRYLNASDVLPDELLREIQKYTQGEVIYIPKERTRKKWGEETGSRNYYKDRNESICTKYLSGNVTMEELAEEYNLSTESIRKIIY